MKNPLVSCLTATYGRPILLGECIKCFLDQDYDNKELIVLNDQQSVELVLDQDYPNIKLLNHPRRFNSLGEKRNYLKMLGNGELFCIWDDDDLYMPWRIRESVRLMKSEGNKYDIIKARLAFMSTHNSSYIVTQNLFHSQACVAKEYMDKTNYPNISVGEDMKFEEKARIGSFDIKPFYIYRWGLGIHHLSGISDQKQSWDKSLIFEPYTKLSGKIIIKPEFQNDYWKAIDSFFRK